MDYDIIKSMKVQELKDYLRLRGLKVTGRKEELVARVFSAVENEVPVVKNAEEVEKQIATEYDQKLKVDDKTIPDPFKLKTGWKDEEEGIVFWPVVSTFYIIKFLMIDSQVEDLNDYKASKAYSYFKQGWLGQISYHPLGSSPYCLLKTDCRPSQRLNDTKHMLWLLISKNDGNVLRAHCSCMAGMGSTCNHIAAALFRIEAVMHLGLLNPACTAKPCEWLPNRKQVEPCKVKNMNLNRDDFTKRGKSTKKLISTPKKNYNPINNLKEAGLKPLTFQSIVHALGEVVESTVLSTAIPKPKIDFVREILTKKTMIEENIPSIDDVLVMSTNQEDFLQNLFLNLTPQTISRIEEITRGQNTNELWYSYRKGVITASKGHEVKTKMVKVDKQIGGHVDVWNLVQKVSGYTFINPNIPALKYGRDMEIYAAKRFEDIFKATHKNVKLIDCGLFLCKNKPYIGASPDRIVTCSCHPNACLEIKCPYSISYLSPKDKYAKLNYMITDNDEFHLKRSHKYFTQCQQQMGVTGLAKCYFFVYTAHGYILDEIEFDKSFYKEFSQQCIKFYDNFYLKSVYK